MFDPAGKVYRMSRLAGRTARKRREDAVRFLAYHDSLTGCQTGACSMTA